MAAKQLDTSLVEKKFSSARATPDSIQSVALWTLTHKSQCDQIVATWLSVLKTSKIEKRLTLFYICNEIVQTCRKKHAIIYKDAFKEVLRDAAILARDKSISDNVKRIFKIWQERGTYDKDFVQELTNLLTGAKVQPSSSKLLSEFNPATLRETLKEFVSKEAALNDKKRSLTSVNVELNSKQIARLFKDRNQGKQYSQQIKDSLANLTEFVSQMENMIVERVSVIDKLECALLFYETQYGEAKIVTNAYRNFGNRIKNLQKKLEEQKKILPSPASPVPSPPTDAPSPVDSLNGDCNRDNMEMVDMDLSDEEVAAGTSTSDTPATLHQSYATSGQVPLIPTSHGINSLYCAANSFINHPPPFRNPSILDITRPPPNGSPRFQSSFQHRPFTNPVFYNQFRSPLAATQHSQFQPTNEALTAPLTSNSQFIKSQTTSMDDTSVGTQKSEMSFTNNLASSEVISQQSLNAVGNSFVTSNSWKTANEGHFTNSANSYTNPQIRFSGTQETASHPIDSVKPMNAAVPEGILNSGHITQNSNAEKSMDPFSLLDQLLAQSRKSEKTSNGSQKSLFDLLANNAKPTSVTSLASASSTPVLDDVQSSNEKIQFNGLNRPSHVEAAQVDMACDSEAFSVKNVNQTNPSIALEKNILSTVSDIKPDVFEILKSIVNSTKQPAPIEKDVQVSNLSPSLSSSKQIQENDCSHYTTAESDFMQHEVSREPTIDSQNQYYSEEQYDDPSFASENENDSMQDRNFSPPTVVPPSGPLVAPKCFFEIYTNVAGNFGEPEDGEMDVMDPSMSDIHDDSTMLPGPQEQDFDCYDNYESHDNYYPEDDLNGPNFNPEVCEDFGEHVVYNDHMPFNENNYLPPRPHFNFRPDFNRNHFNRNVRFAPPRPPGFHEFPRQRFPEPRFFGRGYFPR